MPIKRLSVQLANQIAAGEVVERPSSVVKELVENAVDAGATVITLEIRGSGKQLIKVTDNGKGIPEDELALALAPHATSKIACLEDLAAIVTMGFRGEALASIASVSRLSLISRTADQPHACQVEVSGPEQNPVVAPAAHPVGTSVIVSDLFFNTPARRHFLKSDKTEFNHIKDLMIRLALVNYGIEFRFIADGKTVLHVQAQTRARLGDRIAQLLGREFKNDVLRFDNGDESYVNAYRRYLNLAVPSDSGADVIDDGLSPDDYDPLSRQVLSIYGVLVRPQSFTRATPDRLLTFLNGRCISDRTVNHAIREAYLNAVQQDMDFKPCIRGVIFMECDPRTVDVNVHPRKDEVRFHNSSIIHDCILANVKSVFELNHINRGNARMGSLGVDDVTIVDHSKAPQDGISPEEIVRRRREALGTERSRQYAAAIEQYLSSSLNPLHPLPDGESAAQTAAAGGSAPGDTGAAALTGRLCCFADLLARARKGDASSQALEFITRLRHGQLGTDQHPSAQPQGGMAPHDGMEQLGGMAPQCGMAPQSGMGPSAQPSYGRAGIWNGSLFDEEEDILPDTGSSSGGSSFSCSSGPAQSSQGQTGAHDDSSDVLEDDDEGHQSGFSGQGGGSARRVGPSGAVNRGNSAFSLDFLLQTQERERITRMLNNASRKGQASDESSQPPQASSTAETVDDAFAQSAAEALNWAAAADSPSGAASSAVGHSPEPGTALGSEQSPEPGSAHSSGPSGLVFDSAASLERARAMACQAHDEECSNEGSAVPDADAAGAAGADSHQDDQVLHRSMMSDAATAHGGDAQAAAAAAAAGAAAAAASAMDSHTGTSGNCDYGYAMGAGHGSDADHDPGRDYGQDYACDRAREYGDRYAGAGGAGAGPVMDCPGMQRMSADQVSELMSLQGKCQFQSLVTADVALMNIGSRYFMVRCSELYYSRSAFEYARDVQGDQVKSNELPMPFAIRCDGALIQACRSLEVVQAAARCGFGVRSVAIRSSIELSTIPALASGCNLAAVALEALRIIAAQTAMINLEARCPQQLAELMARCRPVAINTAYDARNLIEGIDSMMSLQKAAEQGALMEISLLDMARVLLGARS